MRTKAINLMMGLWVMLAMSACISDHDLQDCPPLKVVLYVEDKNYFNIEDAEELNLMQAVPEDLPLKEYIKTLQYVILDESRQIVTEQKLQAVETDQQELVLELPTELPYGQYSIVALGNTSSTKDLKNETCLVDLESEAHQNCDIYMAQQTMDYQYGKELHRVPLKRTKGKMLIKIEDFPNHINYSTKEINPVYTSVDTQWQYSGQNAKETELAWDFRCNGITQTLCSPAASKSTTLLNVRFGILNDNGEVDNQPSHFEQPEEMEIPLKRNELTILKFTYTETGLTIFIFVNDEWQKIHSMEID